MAGIARKSTPDPPGAPPLSFTHFQSHSHDQNPTTEFVGSPSSALAHSGDPRPTGIRARLVSGDLFATGENGAPEAVNPWAPDLNRSPLIQRPDLRILVRVGAPTPGTRSLVACAPGAGPDRSAPPHPEPLTALAHLSIARARARRIYTRPLI